MIEAGAPSVRAQLGAAFVVALVSAGLLMLLARQLGPAGFAIYGIAGTVATLALIVQDGGNKLRLFRELTRPTDAAAHGNALMAGAVGWALAATAAVIVLGAFYGLTVSTITALAIATAVLTNIGKACGGFASAAMRARNDFTGEAWAQVRRQLTVAIFVVIAALVAPSPLSVLAAALAGQSIAIWASRDRSELRPPHFAWPAASLLVIELATMAYSRLDQLLLASLWKDIGDVGRYLAVTRVIDIYVFALTPLAAIFFREARINPAGVSMSRFGVVAGVLSLPALLAFPIVLAFGEPLLVLLFGPDYSDAARYLPYFVAAMLLLAPNFLAGQLLLARNRERQFLIAVLVALVAKALLSLILIPRFGPLGCAITVPVTELVLFVALMLSIGRS